MGRQLEILVLDDKEHARLQIEHSIEAVGGLDHHLDWVDRLDGLAGLSGRHYDLAFVDFFLDKDKAYGSDCLGRLSTDCVVGFSSNAAASEAIKKEAERMGFARAAAIEKIKTALPNPALEAFFRALPAGLPTEKPRWLYRQSGVVPFLYVAEGLRIVLVSSRSTGEWIVPKGVVERLVALKEQA